MRKTEFVWLCLIKFICLIVSVISVEILFFVYGMKFGLLCRAYFSVYHKVCIFKDRLCNIKKGNVQH